MPKNQLDLYIENQAALLEKHKGKLIAVADGEFQGEYPDELAAYRDMKKRGFQDREYMIIKCTPGDSAYTIGIWPQQNLR